MVFVVENSLRSGSVPQISRQMHVTHTLGVPADSRVGSFSTIYGVPMLCPHNLLILATPLASREINVLMSTCQISTLVEDSNAEKHKIKEVEEPDHTFFFEE